MKSPAESARSPLPAVEPSRYQLAPGVWLDARRAVWLERESVLAVADLHLGYCWAQRRAGQLLPVNAPDNTLARLAQLREAYRPKQMIVLGDVVHRAHDLPNLANELRALFEPLGGDCTVRLAGGNHDRHLEKLLVKLDLSAKVESWIKAGPHLLIHGDADCTENGDPSSAPCSPTSGYLVMGHEHPAICIGDGLTTSVKCPCFLASRRVLVVPAFSEWASGSAIGREPFMSPLARGERFELAVAIVNGKLLPVRLQ